MPYRIEIAGRQGVRDARGHDIAKRSRRYLGLNVQHCETRDIYKIDAALTQKEVQSLRKAFTDPVVSLSSIGRHRPPARFDWLIEIAFRPGVTDNVGRTAQTLTEEMLGRPLAAGEGVYTSMQVFLRAQSLSREGVKRLALDLLANHLLQTVSVFTREEWLAAPIDTAVPAIREPADIQVRTYALNVSDDELKRISREGILSLSLAEMHAVRDHFNRPEVQAVRRKHGLPEDPTDVELECIAQTWSEHCKHKIFAARIHYTDAAGCDQWIDSLFSTYIKAATRKIGERIDWLVSVFTDNAGVIRFNDRFHLAYKVETHNTPSALDPYGGAMTGIVGCNRDPMGTGMGCELLYNTWGYCLASPFYDGPLPEGLFHPRRIRDGVHEGVIDGGNQSGIPWARGFERFDERFLGKPLVFCGTVGRIPVEVGGRPSERKEVEPGDVLVMVGGRIGKDGIHGATFSSEELHHQSPAQAVQIGDPITQRKMYEFLIEARDMGLYRAITDNGAGGLSCSAGEMGLYCGGVELDLAKAPLKYDGLQPWEILLSEAQERMTLAVDPAHLNELLDLARRRDVEAAALGVFRDSGTYLIRHAERAVGLLDMTFLYEGCPRLTLEARWAPPEVAPPPTPKPGSRTRRLVQLLGRLNLCSNQYKARQYDAEVKGLSVVKPFTGRHADVPPDATILLADHAGTEGVVLAEGINPFYSDLDAYAMAAGVIDEAVRRVVSAGGRWDRIAGLDNFCWPDPVPSPGNPDAQYKMAQLVRANQALYEVTTAYDVPCISGKDSMKNDSVRGGRRISIPPTLLFSTLGKIDDVRRAVTPAFKAPGDIVLALGLTRAELGASEWHRLLAEEAGRPADIGGQVPTVRIPEALALYPRLAAAIARGWVRSSHTPTLGGLAVALARAALAGELGAEIQLRDLPIDGALSDDARLFSESHSRFLITCTPAHLDDLLRHFHGQPIARIGVVNDTQRLVIRGQRDRRLVDTPLRALRRTYGGTLHGF